MAGILAIRKFIEEEVWKTPLRTLPRFKAFWYRQIRIWVITFQEYERDKCAEKASALTYYSILSIVPVIALAFGIATAFGLEEYLQVQMEGYFAGQQEVLNYMITFANSTLSNASGGLISGISVLFLIFTVGKLFNNIELSFNSIWQTPGGRSFQRKVADYMSVIFLGPIILIFSSTATVFLTTQIENLAEQMAFLGYFQPVIVFLIQLIPYSLIWLLLFMVYMVFPNTQVKPWPALIAGILAGTIYQVLQWAYINFQIGVSNYSAIYGSFAALPLFLIWLQLSWIITLFGAEYAFAVQNVGTWSHNKTSLKVSQRVQKKVCILVAIQVAKTLHNLDKGTKFTELCESILVPQWLIKQACEDLVNVGILARLNHEEVIYMPAIDLSKLTILTVVNRVEAFGGSEFIVKDSEGNAPKLDSTFEEFDQLLATNESNRLLISL